MRILALDTATTATTVALAGAGDAVLEARHDPPGRARPGHATQLLPLAGRLLEQAGIDWGELDLIAVGVGPWSFTGLRIGIATARALSRGRGIPLVGVSTLQSLAMNAARRPLPAGLDTVVAALDARRGEVFAASWRWRELADPQGALLPEGAFAPEALAQTLATLAPSALAIGDGALEFRPVLERSGAFVPENDSELHRVTAVNHCRIARRLDGGEPNRVLPHYLRPPDAKPTLARRAAAKP